MEQHESPWDHRSAGLQTGIADRREAKLTNAVALIAPTQPGTAPRTPHSSQHRYNPRLMGKGDRRTKRGKIFQGTTGKRRPKRRKK